MPPAGISVCSRARTGPLRRSSRYMVTSSDPTGTSTPSTEEIFSAMRRASGTPRLGIPSSTRSRGPLLRSRISWAMRVRAREMSRPSITTRPTSLVSVFVSGRALKPLTSFSASRDGSLKDVDRGDPSSPGLRAVSPRSVSRPVPRPAPCQARPRADPPVPRRRSRAAAPPAAGRDGHPPLRRHARERGDVVPARGRRPRAGQHGPLPGPGEAPARATLASRSPPWPRTGTPTSR